jgi:transcription antitermination protein NusB
VSGSAFASRRDRIDRVRARSWALQILYAWEAGGSEGTLRDALVETTAMRRVAPSRLAYIRRLLDTVDAHRVEIDRRLADALDNWRLERLAAVDRAIVRLAAAEILYLAEIPPRVSLQEAVHLAEQYGGHESPRFVNGVLDALYKHSLDEPGG